MKRNILLLAAFLWGCVTEPPVEKIVFKESRAELIRAQLQPDQFGSSSAASEVNETTQVIRGLPVAPEEWTEQARTWLARSLIGEVGWDRPAEQAAVAWVYANRARKLEQYTFVAMVKRYSAAIRRPGKLRAPWLFELQPDNRSKPKSWPEFARWKNHRSESWIAVLDVVDRWQAGEIPNYCPDANHFGNYGDRLRALSLRWTSIQCRVPQGGKRFRNFFFDSTRIWPQHARAETGRSCNRFL
jgi:hypothetical protein